MKKTLLMLVLLCGVYSAQAIKIIHGPYVQALGEREATIMWVTDAEAMSWVEIAPNDKTHFYKIERPKYYNSFLGKNVFGTVHQVKIKGLEPGTTYRYAVHSKEVLQVKKHRVHYGNIAYTDVYRKGTPKFTTLNPNKSSVNFVVLNDIHSKQDKLESLLDYCYEKGKTDMFFYNGDMVSIVPTEQTLFDGFVTNSVKKFGREIPFYLARGNHETRGMFATSYLKYFPTSTGMPYYTLKHGDVFFIVLDSGEDKPDSNVEYYETANYDNYRKEQAEWLKEVVDSEECKNAKYRVVLMHMPPLKGNKVWHGPTHAAECFLPYLNKANITVMLCGHTHKYSFNNTPETTDAKFPVLVNGNNAALKAKVDNNGIKIDVVDVSGAIKYTHRFK